MRNPFTVRIETWLGGVLILAVSAFLVGFFVLALKNFNSDTDILNATGAKIRIISSQEKLLMDKWLKENNTGLSVQDVGYRYILMKFPDRPWITGE